MERREVDCREKEGGLEWNNGKEGGREEVRKGWG